jgi:hypothetical protein
MKQTAVDWLSEQLLNLDIEFDSILINRANYWVKRNNILEQAKEMEKQQIIDAHLDGQCFSIAIEEIDYAEEYYNETFKQ